MPKSKPLLLPAILLFALAPLGRADVVLVPITVNTSSISGTTGSLDLQFNPGPLVSQSASLTILNFTSGTGTLSGTPELTGTVSGALPSSVVFSNGTVYNDYFQAFKYGSTLSFTVELYGPAVIAPNGTATSGSEFALSMFSDAAGTMPTLTNDAINGFAAKVDVGLNGMITASSSSSQTIVGAPTDVPEPSGFAFMAIATIIGGATLLASRRTKVTS